MIKPAASLSFLQKAAFRAIARGAVVPPRISPVHYQVTPQNIPYFLAAVKKGGSAGLCFKFVLNERKEALFFEGASTMHKGHAQHNELANEVWGAYGYRFYDIKGGFVHASYDRQQDLSSLVFYGFSATFNVSPGGGDIDHDLYVENDNGIWIAARAAGHFLRIAEKIGESFYETTLAMIDYQDPETGSAVTGYQVSLKQKEFFPKAG